MIEFKDIKENCRFLYAVSTIDEAIEQGQQNGDFVSVKNLQQYNKGRGWVQYQCGVVGDGWTKTMFVMVK